MKDQNGGEVWKRHSIPSFLSGIIMPALWHLSNRQYWQWLRLTPFISHSRKPVGGKSKMVLFSVDCSGALDAAWPQPPPPAASPTASSLHCPCPKVVDVGCTRPCCKVVESCSPDGLDCGVLCCMDGVDGVLVDVGAGSLRAGRLSVDALELLGLFW